MTKVIVGGEFVIENVLEGDEPMRSTEILVAEHREVEKALAELESLIDEFLTSPEVPDASKQALTEIAEFLGRDLNLHIQKEDDGLFPALEKFLPRDQGPLAVMLDEHEEVTRSYLGLRDGVAELTEHPSTHGRAASRIRDNGRLLIQVLRAHLFKEERILFPFAEGHLSEEDDRQIVQKFDQIAAGAAASKVAG